MGQGHEDVLDTQAAGTQLDHSDECEEPKCALHDNVYRCGGQMVECTWMTIEEALVLIDGWNAEIQAQCRWNLQRTRAAGSEVGDM